MTKKLTEAGDGNLGGVGLPNDFHSAFPDFRAGMDGKTAALSPSSAVLRGPGNFVDNPDVGIYDKHMILPDGVKVGALPPQALTPATMGIPPADARGEFIQPGSDVRPELARGIVPNAEVPHDDTFGYGLGTR